MMRRFSALAFAAAALALAGCTPPNQSSSSNPPQPTSNTPSGSSGTSSSEKIKIGVMPKKVGIPYFAACQQGVEEAGKELKDVEVKWDGPTEDKSEDQSKILDTWRTLKYNAVAVACNDPQQISTSLARCRDDGMGVVTWDADANPTASKRQFFVNQAGVDDLAKKLVDEMVKQTGDSAKVGVVSSSPTAPNQVAWLKAMRAYAKEKYPKLTILPDEYAGEQQDGAEAKAGTIMKVNPDVKGIFGMTSVAFPGAANAVKQANKGGQVAVVGLGTPNEMKPFVEAGVVKSVVLWNPVDLGYLTVYVARAVAKGELKAGDTSIKAGRLGECKVKGQEVMLGDPMVFTKENIAKFNF
jgi:ABC-type sugar transport system substrate-binding protein